MTRRRRALLLGGLAILLGTLAASDVAGREAALERELHPLVPVVVARAPLPAGEPIAVERLAVREVPARFAPRDALASPAEAAGRTLAVPVAAGADVGLAALREEVALGAPVRRGERVAEVVAAGSPELVVPGTRVDVLVTRDARPGAAGRTELALEDVEVLAAAPAPEGGAGDAPPGARVAASLRVTLRQAVFLAAAQGFARELRLLPRPPGDRGGGAAGLAYGEDLG